jgi:iron complex transport system substrate-binding protein
MIARDTGMDVHCVTRVDDVTRRELLTIAVTAAFLAACGEDKEEAPSPEATTRTIDTAKGQVTIPVSPERVICVINYAMHALFSLGFNPIGVPDGFASAVLPEHAALYEATAKVGPWNQIDLEKVAGLNPDLILGLDIEWNTPIYDRLAAIAPTALFTLTGTSDWAWVTAEFAGAVGRTKELEALETQYRDRVASIRSTYAEILGSTRWAIANEFQGGWVLWYPDSSGGQVMTDAGVQLAVAAAGRSGNFSQLSHEQINELADADVIVIRSSSPTGFAVNTQAWIDQPAFKLLKAARDGHVYPLTRLFPYSYRDALALLDEVEGILSKLRNGA